MTAPAISSVFRALVAIAAGAVAGIGGYTFLYARGASYLVNDPRACANCHVMTEHYDAWTRSSHRTAATCNDCHTPPGFIPKYAAKAQNGFWHSFAFTTGDFPEPLRIKPDNRRITENACRGCHGPIVTAIEGPHAGATQCARCHGAVGHPL